MTDNLPALMDNLKRPKQYPIYTWANTPIYSIDIRLLTLCSIDAGNILHISATLEVLATMSDDLAKIARDYAERHPTNNNTPGGVWFWEDRKTKRRVRRKK
jgi:hypothetical protein